MFFVFLEKIDIKVEQNYMFSYVFNRSVGYETLIEQTLGR